MRVDFVTEYRSFSIWFVPESKGWKQRDDWGRFNAATDGCARHPRTVTYCKDAESGFYRLVNINQEEDRAPEQSAIQTALEDVR